MLAGDSRVTGTSRVGSRRRVDWRRVRQPVRQRGKQRERSHAQASDPLFPFSRDRDTQQLIQAASSRSPARNLFRSYFNGKPCETTSLPPSPSLPPSLPLTAFALRLSCVDGRERAGVRSTKTDARRSSLTHSHTHSLRPRTRTLAYIHTHTQGKHENGSVRQTQRAKLLGHSRCVAEQQKRRRLLFER